MSPTNTSPSITVQHITGSVTSTFVSAYCVDAYIITTPIGIVAFVNVWCMETRP